MAVAGAVAVVVVAVVVVVVVVVVAVVIVKPTARVISPLSELEGALVQVFLRCAKKRFVLTDELVVVHCAAWARR